MNEQLDYNQKKETAGKANSDNFSCKWCYVPEKHVQGHEIEERMNGFLPQKNALNIFPSVLKRFESFCHSLMISDLV